MEALWSPDLPSRSKVWTILDGAADKRIYGEILATSLEKCCLYAGDLPWQLEIVAPYLVELDQDDDLTRFILTKGWGKSWGIFLRTEAGIKTLRKHLRGFLRVQDPRGKYMLFRYYDPRVLRAYLPTCLPSELRTVFGPINCFLLESENTEQLVEFRFDGKGLVSKPRTLI